MRQVQKQERLSSVEKATFAVVAEPALGLG